MSMGANKQGSCRQVCWLSALGFGAVIAALLVFVALFPAFSAVLIGGLIGLALGPALSWAFCTGAGASEAVAPSSVRDSAAPHKTGEAAEPRRGPPPGEAEHTPAAKAAGARPKAMAKGIEAAMGRTHEETVAPAEPLLLLAPRHGRADDLKLISGVGPALEKLLNEVGVWHFDQIASWKAKDIAFVDSKLKTFRGRITRDEWVKQARALARTGGAEGKE